MTRPYPIASDQQLARLLQIGVVLEEMIGEHARNHRQLREGETDRLDAILENAIEQAETHRRILEGLIEDSDADVGEHTDIEPIVEAQYRADQHFDDIIYDQLCNVETAYKFFEDLIDALEASESEFSIRRENLLATLTDLRDAEADSVQRVTDLMEAET